MSLTELLKIHDSKSNANVTNKSLHTTLVSSNGNEALVNEDGQLHTVLAGKVDDNNSSSTPLAADAVFTGTSVETLEFAVLTVFVYSDKASATDGLSIQFSIDGTNWDGSDVFTIPAATGKTFSFQPQARYYRVVYTNGSTTQTQFRLQSILKKSYVKPSSHRIQDAIIDDDDAELVKAVITGKKDNDEFDNVSLTNKGNVKVALQEYGDTSAIDAFARQRISQPYTIFDSKQLHDKQPLFWDEEIGGSATSVHSSSDARVRMTVTASSSDYVIRQTKQRFNYQPGKSQLAIFTFYAPQSTGIMSRIGYFSGDTINTQDPVDGIFIESNSNISWNICKGGSITETVTQANWNIDTLDGSGDDGNLSEITLDFDGGQIAFIDFEWLGLGRVRCGFFIGGLPVYVHEFKHANNSSFSSVYMSSPNLPMRYEIRSDGTGGGTLDHICSTVISEGGLEKTGILRSVESRGTQLSATLGGGIGTKYALVGIRLNAAYRDVTVLPESITMLLGTNDAFTWELHLNPVVAGTWSYVALENSAVQFAKIGGASNTTITTDGIIIARGGGSKDSRTSAAELKTALTLGSDISGTRDALVLVIGLLANNVTAWATINFRELL
jgi:hypothetical protein